MVNRYSDFSLGLSVSNQRHTRPSKMRTMQTQARSPRCHICGQQVSSSKHLLTITLMVDSSSLYDKQFKYFPNRLLAKYNATVSRS